MRAFTLDMSTIKALGEVNLRVRNLEKMTKFYTNVLGLKKIYKSNKHVFLRVANGYGGLTHRSSLYSTIDTTSVNGNKYPRLMLPHLNTLLSTLDSRIFNQRRDGSKKRSVSKLARSCIQKFTGARCIFTIQKGIRLSWFPTTTE